MGKEKQFPSTSKPRNRQLYFYTKSSHFSKGQTETDLENFAPLEKVLKRQLSLARPWTASGEGVRIGFFCLALREDKKKLNNCRGSPSLSARKHLLIKGRRPRRGSERSRAGQRANVVVTRHHSHKKFSTPPRSENRMGMGKLWSGGRMRPVKVFNPA